VRYFIPIFLPTLLQEKTYDLTINVSTCESWFALLSAAWIDFNQNNQYDAWEQIVSFSSATGVSTRSFTVPSTNGSQQVLVGATRLRVQVQETTQNFIDPCMEFSYGGTKEYLVIITGGDYCVSGPYRLEYTTLGNVTLTGPEEDLFDGSSCTTDIGPQNLTHLVADVIVGNTFTLSYLVFDCNDTGDFPPTVTSAAWIDYNQNKQFEEWEQLFQYNQAFGYSSKIFKVPLSTPTQSVVLGRTRLRLQVQDTINTVINPCTYFAYGGTKDYSIDVKPLADGQWSDWSVCSADCGNGTQTRACNAPPPTEEGDDCFGPSVQACNTHKCSDDDSNVAVAVGVTVPIILLCAAFVGYYFYRKRQAAGLGGSLLTNEDSGARGKEKDQLAGRDAAYDD